MAQARDIYGNVFAHGCATLLARVNDNHAARLTPGRVSVVRMSILMLDADVTQMPVFVRGYKNVAVPVTDVLFDTLQHDARWQVDSLGYNFRHTLTNRNGRIFTQRGRHYLVVYKFTPASDAERHAEITLRFRIFVI